MVDGFFESEGSQYLVYTDNKGKKTNKQKHYVQSYFILNVKRASVAPTVVFSIWNGSK